MKHPRNIFLIGPMGAGKSAVGRYLARALHQTFVDSDDEIESRTGVDIPFIFEKEGEDGFRKREAVVIDDLSKWTVSCSPLAAAPYWMRTAEVDWAAGASSCTCTPRLSSRFHAQKRVANGLCLRMLIRVKR